MSKTIGERVASVIWRAIPFLVWLPLTVGLYLVLTPAFMRGLTLPVFPERSFFVLYGTIGIAGILLMSALWFALIAAWSFMLAPFVPPDQQLVIIRGSHPPKAPARRFGELLVRAIHGHT